MGVTVLLFVFIPCCGAGVLVHNPYPLCVCQVVSADECNCSSGHLDSESRNIEVQSHP